MNKREIKDIKAVIEAEIIKTEKTIFNYKEMTQPIAPENAIGRISRMDAINNKSVADAALRQAEKKLEGLKNVLSQVGKDDFDLCAKCKKKIPLGRILLMPHIRYCVQCAK